VTAGASPVVSLAGLTTLGTATYLVRVNAAGTGWEYINPATVVGGPYLALAGGTMTGAISLGAFQLTSTVATGTAPFVVASTTLVANLHAANSDALGDKIIGTSGNKVPLLDGANTFSAAQTIVGDLTVGANDSTTRSLIIKASNAQYFEGICNTGTAYFSTVGISLAFQSATSVDIKSGRVGSTNYAVDINYGPSSSTGPLRFWGAGSSTAVWSCTSGGDVIGAGTCSASGFKVGSTAGIDATVALAKLTPVTGTNGSLTITKGIITAYVAPT
jgi:hypothetical protein